MHSPHPTNNSDISLFPPPTVVVVDDDPGIVELVLSHLGALGYAVEGFTDPADALVRLRRAPTPDIAVVDCIMPRLTGAEICAALAEAGIDVPVVLMTALADPSFAVHLERASVLTKPFLLDDLVVEIEARLRPRSGPRSGGTRSFVRA